MSRPSSTHLVLIPSYDTGPILVRTVAQAAAFWKPVWVVIDGSTDGSGEALSAWAQSHQPDIRILHKARNSGKGAAILFGLEEAARSGYTHVLTMDADGQHPAASIPDFMAHSRRRPGAMILGVPEFGTDAPALRVRGRRISNWWVNLETMWTGIDDSLFGFRVYPIDPLLRIMRDRLWMRRFDFDPEAVVRLNWVGVPALPRSAPVRYLTPEQGGVSHFDYVRDNVLLTFMHIRLMLEWLVRWPVLAARRRGLLRRSASD